VHTHPEDAASDGAQSLIPENFSNMMRELRVLAKAIGREI
jgi:3-deoxy-7-phosphoheptulonate synthase